MLPLKFLESRYGYQPHPESYADPGLLSLVAEEDFSRLTMETIVQHDACNAPIRVILIKGPHQMSYSVTRNHSLSPTSHAFAQLNKVFVVLIHKKLP